ncbi:MAG TPA: TonB family protein [Pyrinomonadaceae bacterium]|nr:TonB family protein [Pyrinomonadaceae bacterium]
MSNRLSAFTLAIVALLAISTHGAAQTSLTKSLQPAPVDESDRVRDGLVGPVRRIRTEIVKLSLVDGKLIEGNRSLMELVSYDLDGKKIDNQYFPQTGATLTGKEVYKYDEKGNISEMTLLNEDGTLMSKEVYKYTFDFAGNWNRMTTSVAVVEGGKVVYEPSEITYRSIMYYLDENTFKMVQSGASPAWSAQKPSSKVALPNQPQNSVTNKPVASALPSATVAIDALNNAASAEVADSTSSGVQSIPRVVVDGEPPPSSPKPILKPISGGVLNGTAISLPTPVYPDNARRMRTSGLVSVEVVVDETGKVISAKATSGPPLLREVSEQAATRAKFSPTKLSGQPVKVAGIINYKFTLAQ